MADKKIDHRFDPAFQRGYATGNAAAESAGATQAARGVDAHRSEAAAQTRPSVARAAAAPQESPASTTSAVMGGQSAYESAPHTQYVDDDGTFAEIAAETTRTSLARNPWIYALWALAGALVAIGVYGLWWSISGLYVRGGLDEDTWLMFNLVQTAAPLFIMAGSFCMTAALLVHALNWIRRNP